MLDSILVCVNDHVFSIPAGDLDSPNKMRWWENKDYGGNSQILEDLAASGWQVYKQKAGISPTYILLHYNLLRIVQYKIGKFYYSNCKNWLPYMNPVRVKMWLWYGKVIRDYSSHKIVWNRRLISCG